MTGAALRMIMYDLASLFRGRRNTLDRWTNCFVFDVVNFENEEVSQNCFAFDVAKCRN